VVFNSTQIFPYVAVSKDALSNSPAEAADSSNHSACQNKHRSLAWVSSAISGFRSLCGRKRRSSLAIALEWTCVLEPFTRGGLSLWEPCLHP